MNSLEVEIEPKPASVERGLSGATKVMNSSEVGIETNLPAEETSEQSYSVATKVMRQYDKDGDGKFSKDEVHAMAADFIKEKKTRRLATKAAIAMGVLILLVVGLNAGLTAAIVFLSKDLKVTTGGMLTPDDKQVAQVAVAKQFIPLGLASYMTQSELLTIDKVALTKRIFNVTDNTSTPYQSSYTVLGYEWFSYHDMHFTLSDGGNVRISDGNAWCVHIPSHSHGAWLCATSHSIPSNPLYIYAPQCLTLSCPPGTTRRVVMTTAGKTARQARVPRPA